MEWSNGWSVAGPDLSLEVPGMAEQAVQGRNAPWSEWAQHAADGTSAAGNRPVETNKEIAFLKTHPANAAGAAL